MTNYIYLLQEHKFVVTLKNIYKVGTTKKENNKGFYKYPKGSIILFQMICNDCKNIENSVLKTFKENFIHRIDIGNKYFEGDYNEMIDIIYLNIKKEDETPIYEITTYEEWIKFNEIDKIIINSQKGEGYLRFKGQLWRKLYDKNSTDYDEDHMEYLLGFIEKYKPDIYKMVKPYEKIVNLSEMIELKHCYENNVTNEIISYEEFKKLSDSDKEKYTKHGENKSYEFIGTEYNIDKILQDTLKKCYVKDCDFYNLNYHEYVLSTYNNKRLHEYVIFNSLNLSFVSVDELINNKILTSDKGGKRMFYIKNIIDINIVDNILESLINDETKKLYKKLVYNLIVKQEETQIIFYDYNECLLTTWIKDLLYSISNDNYINSSKYYENKSKFKKTIQTNRTRCVIINKHDTISIEKQINDLSKIGIKNIIVCQDDKTNNMYNIINFRKYLLDNKEILMECIKNEHNYVSNSSWENMIQYDDSIFYSTELFLTNYFKWCCVY